MQHIRKLAWVTLIAPFVLAGCGETADAQDRAADTGFRGVVLDEPVAKPDFTLTDTDGRPFHFREETEGRLALVFFGYTNCPDICPTTLADWAKTRAELGRRADRVRFVFVSVDPERDTPEVADAYAKKFDSSFIGLSPDSASLERIRKGFRISSWREDMPDGGPYAVAHSAQSFLVDRKGMVRLIYPFGFTSSELAEDLRRLM